MFTRRCGLVFLVFAGAALLISPLRPHAVAAAATPHTGANYPDSLALTPPLGWNSYDSFGGAVNESEFRDNAKYVADHLARYGWKYVVVDYYWYFAESGVEHGSSNEDKIPTSMDEYGRLLPDPQRFPSAAGGKGFKPLADYVHSLGLKFGIHIMRGIPRQAVERNLPIYGAHGAHAQDVADLKNTCPWSKAMDGVDVTSPAHGAAGQAYYDSLARLYAAWGVDFIKADDMSRGNKPPLEDYHGPEIEALRKAMNKTGRPMVLSLSPGATPLDAAASVSEWSQMWRISDDMWDNWKEVDEQFARARDWARYSGPNHWPDADMLPLGLLRVTGFDEPQRQSRLTRDEQVTLMTLWSISRSPLMMGGDLRSLDPWTASLLENAEVLAVDHKSSGNHEVFERGSQVGWEADAPGGQAKYVALFNTGESPKEMSISWAGLGLNGKYDVRDLWHKHDLGAFQGRFANTVSAHGAALYKMSPAAH
ncbi:MAG TPA: alpha-galactosidase [Terriglobia bacterium]|nr:alpha-galactosidase [Terriglobia bacterium]